MAQNTLASVEATAPSSSAVSSTGSTASMNPLGPPCVLCKSKHTRCDRSKPACGSCWKLARDCSYPSTSNTQSSTPKADARPPTITSPDSAVLIRSSSPDPKPKGKRQRADDSPDTIRNGNGSSQDASGPFQSTKTAQKPSKRTKLTTNNETELRDEEKEQWLEQDELMELAAIRMEKGGRCSRAVLSRWELFLTAPMVDEADRKDLERIIAIEESHSAMCVTTSYNFLHLRRLQRILQDPAAYGVSNHAPTRTYLMNMVTNALEDKRALSRAKHKMIIEFIDPDKEIITPDLSSFKKSEEPALSKEKAAPSSSKTPQPSTPFSRVHSTQLHKDLSNSSASPLSTPSATTLKDPQSAPTSNMSSSIKDLLSSRQTSFQPQQQHPSPKLKPDVPMKLIKIFMEHVAPLLPIFDLDDLDRLLRMTSLHGTFTFRGVDPTLGLCFALAALQSRDRVHWQAHEWYRGAEVEINSDELNENSILGIQRRILQVLYLQMIGNLSKAWSVLSLALGLAEANGIQTVAGGPLAVDSTSQQRVRVLWHSLWMMRLSLATQMGMNWQSLETRYPVPNPTSIPLGSKISQTQLSAISSFFNSSISLYRHMEDILCNDEHLRLRIDICPFRSLFTADLCELFELDGKLLQWKEALPTNLHWDGTGISLSMESDFAIRRLRILIRLRYMFIRLRVFRPFLIFCLRLSHTCSCASDTSHACASGPHILVGKEAESVDSPAILGIVRDSTLKCLAAAQDIIKILTDLHGKGIGKGNDDTLRITTSSYECLDYIYTSALILIACLAIPFIVKGGGASKSASSMNEQLRQADILLRNYEESSHQTDELSGRTRRCREVLDLLKSQIGSGTVAQSPTLFSDVRISVGQHVWKRLYDRLGLQEEASSKEALSSNNSTGRKNFFAWLESLPTDLDGWAPAKTQNA
ncbi:hypothetical protein N7499_008339 [Penicillium canescens]|uniref:Zn(2)-C6 fungal-type domain-containing protein n=1 Tax=Penicillium canescens TaxID=5083 RepID=A0AAD6N2C1_PENCN|nr:uncharacterized protein N7446_013373 [Penicillium canescens]KAJ6023021.1 hypothetical protein N7460_013416 [Penicillium canescens]KAJ6042307.1 hypothetical protein N7446_013373 [Penicillium canescens]KAJ6076358.1 hypothetical protein N7499_008339 [Penicillium canescens]